jgi:hypothetical protein
MTIESLYAAALYLYPQSFRLQYASAMLQSLRDALADKSNSKPRLYFLLTRDLTTSLLKEHFSMLLKTFLRPVLIINALVLAGIATVLALAVYVIPQQVLRQDANDPQIELAENLAQQLNAGATLEASLPHDTIDMAHSLSPFLIAYNAEGKPLASQAKLDGNIPTPPKGVFDYVRANGEDRISWVPQPGARFAAVIIHIPAAKNVPEGFVLAARSLREVEIRQQKLGNLAFFNWLVMMGLVVVGMLAFGWMTRPKPQLTATN